MAQRAGVALSRIAKDALISITRVDGAPDEVHFFKSVEHKLDSDNTNEITDHINGLVGFDTSLKDNAFLISYPISRTENRRAGFRYPAYDHCIAFIHSYDFSTMISEGGDRQMEILFVDLTPGQVAAKLVHGVASNSYEGYRWRSRAITILDDPSDLDPQNIVDKLIIATIASVGVVDLIGIFQPEEASPEIAALLVAQFPKARVEWVSLADLSYGAADIMHRKSTSYTDDMGANHLGFPLGIALANGQIVTLMMQDSMIPRTFMVLLTNSRDNQGTATIRFFNGSFSGGLINIKGLTRKPKGDSRIRVTVSADVTGHTLVTVEEVGSTARKVANISNILDIQEYETKKILKQVEKTSDANGIIGELPD